MTLLMSFPLCPRGGNPSLHALPSLGSSAWTRASGLWDWLPEAPAWILFWLSPTTAAIRWMLRHAVTLPFCAQPPRLHIGMRLSISPPLVAVPRWLRLAVMFFLHMLLTLLARLVPCLSPPHVSVAVEQLARDTNHASAHGRATLGDDSLSFHAMQGGHVAVAPLPPGIAPAPPWSPPWATTGVWLWSSLLMPAFLTMVA